MKYSSMSLYFHYHKSLIKHYLNATFIDVLHSPYVFKMYNESIKKQVASKIDFKQIENLRKTLKQDNSTVTYTDFGALAKSEGEIKHLKVSGIAKTDLKPARIAEILHYLIRNSDLNNCIELGTSLGITTSYLLKALENKSNPSLYSIEASKDVHELAKKNIESLSLQKNAHLILGSFDEQLPLLLEKLDVVDFIFIDGNHSYEATIRYFEWILPKVHENTLIIFDDIYWSEGMTKAWEEIKNHPTISISVDLFFFGIISFRKGQVKEHFKLRIF